MFNFSNESDFIELTALDYKIIGLTITFYEIGYDTFSLKPFFK